MHENSTPDRTNPSVYVRAARFVFILWLVLVNTFYYLQFRHLLLALLGSWIHLWR